MKINEEDDDDMQTFKPLNNLKQFIWTWYSNVHVNLVLKILMQYFNPQLSLFICQNFMIITLSMK
jgi:hypothetical protein